MKMLLRRFPLSLQLLIAPAVVLLLLAATYAVSLLGMRAQTESLSNIYEVRLQRLLSTSEIQTRVERTHGLAFEYLNALISNHGEASTKRLSGQMLAALSMGQQKLQVLLLQSPLEKQEKDNLLTAESKLKTYEKSLNDMVEIASIQPSMAATFLSTASQNHQSLVDTLSQIQAQQFELSNRAYVKALEVSTFSQNLQTVVLIVSLGLGVTLSLLIAKTIAKASHSIERTAQTMSEGKLYARADESGSDELAKTAKAFNRFGARMQSLVESVNDYVHRLKSMTTHMQQCTEGVDAASTKQSDSANEIAQTVERTTAQVGQVTQETHKLEIQARACESIAQDSLQDLEKLQRQQHNIEHIFEKVSHLVLAFVEQAKSIEQINRQTSDIAQRTNLLALNASIEAARAGEMGKGFSVVAQEVKALAERCALAAKQIANVTHNIVAESPRVIEAIENGTLTLKQSDEILTGLENSMQRCETAVAGATDGIESISKALSEHQVGSEEIAKNVDHIAHRSSSNLQAVHQLTDLSRELDQLASRLESEVSDMQTSEKKA